MYYSSEILHLKKCSLVFLMWCSLVNDGCPGTICFIIKIKCTKLYSCFIEKAQIFGVKHPHQVERKYESCT